ncbi:unnamed protein product [Tenebrio molitor]|nr:unnamed protein product [Tenebrio molitor]
MITSNTKKKYKFIKLIISYSKDTNTPMESYRFSNNLSIVQNNHNHHYYFNLFTFSILKNSIF